MKRRPIVWATWRQATVPPDPQSPRISHNRRQAPFGWRGDASLKDWIVNEGYRFEFLQAVRLLESMAAQELEEKAQQDEGTHAKETPYVPLATGPDFERESVRLRAAIHFKFPPREIDSIHQAPRGKRNSEVEAGHDRRELFANFFALAGARSPLPDWVAELLLEQERIGNSGFRDFLDIFHHRLLALHYRVQLAHRPWLDPKLLATSANGETGALRARNTMARYLLSFAGVGIPELQAQMPVGDEELLPFAGLLWHNPRSLAGLTRLVEHTFKINTRVRQRLGMWRTIEPEDRTRIAGSRPARVKGESVSAVNNVLGKTTVLGSQVWDAQGRFDLVLGPLSFDKAQQFLPGQDGHRRVKALLRFYAGDMFTVKLVLLVKDPAPSRLGRARLNWTSWLRPGHAYGAPEIHLSLLS